MNNTNINESSNPEFEEMKLIEELRDNVPDLGWFTRHRSKTSIGYLLKLEAKIIGMIGEKANEAIELEMIPESWHMVDKNGKGHQVHFMGARDIIMWRDANNTLLITRNLKPFEFHHFEHLKIVNLAFLQRELLCQYFACEYEDTPSFTIWDFCAYATDKMIYFQKMIDKLFQGQPINKVLAVESIADSEIRNMLCDSYNAEVNKIDPSDEFEVFKVVE